MASLVTAFDTYAAEAAIREYHGLALDASGQRVAALESLNPGGLPRSPHQIVVVRDARGKIIEQLDPCVSCRYTRPDWAPDQKSLAFIAMDAKARTATLYVATQGAIRPLATFKGIAHDVRWAPDGKQIALLATVDAKKLIGAVEAGAPQVGEIALEEDEQRIGLVTSSGGPIRMVSPADTFVYEYDWTPDGKGFAVTSAKGNGDNNWWVATLGHLDAATGVLRVIAAPKMQMKVPRVSPDGKTVAFIGGLMSDFGSAGGDLFSVPLNGGPPINLTEGFAGTFRDLHWQGRKLIAPALVGSDAALVAVDPATHATHTIWHAPVRAVDYAFSADRKTAAAVHEDFTHAQAIVLGPLAKPAAITHDNDSFGAQVSATNVTWTNEGHKVQGWLLAPAKLEAGKKYPMVVVVHGGPASAVVPRYVGPGELASPIMRALTSHGYFVFHPNPRGSFGQGASFTQANRRDFGGGDWRDILSGVDAVLKVAPVDGERLGLMGHSYGGFMTMWGVTHSQRFKAAVAGAGIANWISYYGQNGIDQWMVPYFGATAYDDPAIYRAASPIASIKAAKTPTFIYVGERDVECPPAQSLEFWHGLRAMGTPVSLVIYPGEGHALRNPQNQRDLRQREVAWFDRYLK